MLTLLRKLRKSMINSSKINKYVVYALGEIALVVIGILIALQINNWNEWRKDRIRENIILNDLVKNIENNIILFHQDIDWLKQNSKSSQIVLDVLDNKSAFVDSLKGHFHNARITKKELFISNVAYLALKDVGTDIIINKTLSDEIVDLFEVSIPQILSTNKLINEEYIEFVNVLVQNFKLEHGIGLTPYNYSSILSNKFYYNWIYSYNEGRKYLIKTDLELIKTSETVLELIKKELND